MGSGRWLAPRPRAAAGGNAEVSANRDVQDHNEAHTPAHSFVKAGKGSCLSLK